LLCLAIYGGAVSASAAEVTLYPRGNPWSDYQILMWQPKTAKQYARLKEIGVTGGAMTATRSLPDAVPPNRLPAFVDAGLSWYVENIATDFYSAYHHWWPDRPNDWEFLQVKKRYWRNPHDPDAFRRVPSLSDPVWLAKIGDRLGRVVNAQQPYRPLFYNLADETGIGDLNAPWDFDFSEESLRGMRAWLKREYGDLASLNEEWGTDFRDWGQVVPMSTRVAMTRADRNFAAWSDFKAWMDVAYARALRIGTDDVHRANTGALAGIEGVQFPGWGGYDYSRLADSVDVMEAPNNYFPVLRSFNPALILVNTSFGSGPAEAHKDWRAFIDGSRGLILWDANDAFVAPDGSLGPRAKEAAPFFSALRGGIGALIVNGERQYDPVAILYSQASMRIQWMLDWRSAGDQWSHYGTESQNRDNPWRGSMRRYREAIVRIGLTPRFVTADGVAAGALGSGVRVLILPDTLALSTGAAAAIRRFVRAGGTVIADREPARFDGHGRYVAEPLLHDLFLSARDAHPRENDGRVYLLPPPNRDEMDSFALAPLRRAIGQAGVAAEFLPVSTAGRPTDNVAIDRWRDGATTILAVQRVETADFAPNLYPFSLPATPQSVTLPLAHPRFVYDVTTHRSLGRQTNVDIALDPVAPTLLVLSPEPLPALKIIGPEHVQVGQAAMFRVKTDAPSTSFDVFHVDVTDASGRLVAGSSINILGHAGAAAMELRFASDAPQGNWMLAVNDVLSGQTATQTVRVIAP
jgi:hypothetical protein